MVNPGWNTRANPINVTIFDLQMSGDPHKMQSTLRKNGKNEKKKEEPNRNLFTVFLSCSLLLLVAFVCSSLLLSSSSLLLLVNKRTRDRE